MPFLDVDFEDADDFVESVTRAHTAIFRRYTRRDWSRRSAPIFIESFDSSDGSLYGINREDFERRLHAKWNKLARLKSMKNADRRQFEPAFNHPGLPRYHPPTKDAAFCILLNATKPPRRPIFPRCLTNTALATYAHKLYIYESYLFNKIQ